MSTDTISLVTKLEDIKTRFNTLNENYLYRAILNDNPLITDSFVEFLAFADSRNLDN